MSGVPPPPWSEHTYSTVRETRLFAEKENQKSLLGLYLAKMSVYICLYQSSFKKKQRQPELPKTYLGIITASGNFLTPILFYDL